MTAQTVVDVGPNLLQVALALVTLGTVLATSRRGNKSHATTDEKLDALVDSTDRIEATLEEHGQRIAVLEER